jgi:hypothetical protein
VKVRVHDPRQGCWGTVTDVQPYLLAALYPDAGYPSHLAFVRWDDGTGGYVDPTALHVSNAAALRPLMS